VSRIARLLFSFPPVFLPPCGFPFFCFPLLAFRAMWGVDWPRCPHSWAVFPPKPSFPSRFSAVSRYGNTSAPRARFHFCPSSFFFPPRHFPPTPSAFPDPKSYGISSSLVIESVTFTAFFLFFFPLPFRNPFPSSLLISSSSTGTKRAKHQEWSPAIKGELVYFFLPTFSHDHRFSPLPLLFPRMEMRIGKDEIVGHGSMPEGRRGSSPIPLFSPFFSCPLQRVGALGAPPRPEEPTRPYSS